MLTIFFHTNVQLDVWFEDWAMRMDHSISATLIDEYNDMRERHPRYFDPPAPVATSTSRARTWTGNVEQWRPLVATFFAPAKVETAMCILARETGFTGNPNALNTKSSAAGLFQFLRSTWNSVPLSVTGGTYDSGMVYDPTANVRAAAWLQSHSGWGQWTVYSLCRGL